MTKKIKDLTLGQLDTHWICSKQKDCLTCPMYDGTKGYGERCLSAVIDDIMVNYQKCVEKEVEVDD